MKCNTAVKVYGVSGRNCKRGEKTVEHEFGKIALKIERIHTKKQ